MLHACYIIGMEDNVNVKLPREIWESIRWIATHENRSGAAQLIVVVRKGLEAYSPKRNHDTRSSLEQDAHVEGLAMRAEEKR